MVTTYTLKDINLLKLEIKRKNDIIENLQIRLREEEEYSEIGDAEADEIRAELRLLRSKVESVNRGCEESKKS